MALVGGLGGGDSAHLPDYLKEDMPFGTGVLLRLA